MSTGIFFVITAPTGAGKTTVAKELLKRIPELNRLVTVTTRPPRSGERDGVDYHFVSPEVFKRMQNENAFIETTYYANFLYGSPKNALDQVKKGKYILAVTDRKGVVVIKKRIPQNSVAIWLTTKTPEICADRLIKRNSESQSQLAERITIAQREMNEEAENPLCEATFINDNLETCIQEVTQFIQDKIRQS